MATIAEKFPGWPGDRPLHQQRVFQVLAETFADAWKRKPEAGVEIVEATVGFITSVEEREKSRNSPTSTQAQT